MASRNILLPALALLLVLSAGLILWQVRIARESRMPVVLNGTAVPPLPVFDRQMVSDGEALYRQYCASCHGSNLEGAPDWKIPLPDGSFPPPPHDDSGHSWHHPDFLLLEIMAKGGQIYDGVMPGFADQITPDEMSAILAFLKSSWSQESRRFQWWVSNTVPTPTPIP